MPTFLFFRGGGLVGAYDGSDVDELAAAIVLAK
jgi:hypothetical protein